MKTLAEHNADARKLWDRIDERMQPHANGIECPKCKAELWDSSPGFTLSSSPPQKNVHCPTCDYHGYRIV